MCGGVGGWMYVYVCVCGGGWVDVCVCVCVCGGGGYYLTQNHNIAKYMYYTVIEVI